MISIMSKVRITAQMIAYFNVMIVTTHSIATLVFICKLEAKEFSKAEHLYMCIREQLFLHSIGLISKQIQIEISLQIP